MSKYREDGTLQPWIPHHLVLTQEKRPTTKAIKMKWKELSAKYED